MSGEWIYGTLVVLSLLHLGALYYSYRKGNETSEQTDGETAVGERRVQCGECGAVNERGYRYCRRCVTELPGQMPFASGSGPPRSRQTM